MYKKTKIVATISDARCGVDFIQKLYDAGMNVVRLNTAHQDAKGMKRVIDNVREVSSHIAVLVDTKGPEVRTTRCEQPIEFKKGELVSIVGNPELVTTHETICVTYSDFVRDVPSGTHILIDDGDLGLFVEEKTASTLLCRVENDAVLGSRKSVNVPGVHINLPALTEKDKQNIAFAIGYDVAFIAHSFVRSKEDVHAVRQLLDEAGSDIRIIAKIENQEGVDNIDEIIEAADGIMVARGDLGIEVPQEFIPGIQRRLVEKAIRAHKPVIVATQMLHTMIDNPRPTRAEVTDIANAIYYSTDALMLSGETASGKYPVEAVETMAQIAEQAEKDRYREHVNSVPLPDDCDVPAFLAHNAIEATERLGVKGIITDSKTGRTARHLAAFRGPNPVLAVCYKEKVQRWLALSYGVIPVAQHEQIGRQEQFMAALRMLRQKGYLDMNDKIAYLSGSFAEGGSTTFLEINTVREVFDRSYEFHLPK